MTSDFEISISWVNVVIKLVLKSSSFVMALQLAWNFTRNVSLTTGKATLGFEEDDSNERGLEVEGANFVSEYDKSPSVSLVDDFVPRDDNNKEESVVLGGISEGFVFNVRRGSLERRDSDGFNFDVVVGNGADDG